MIIEGGILQVVTSGPRPYAQGQSSLFPPLRSTEKALTSCLTSLGVRPPSAPSQTSCLRVLLAARSYSL
jgi:hypothetical protein